MDPTVKLVATVGLWIGVVTLLDKKEDPEYLWVGLIGTLVIWV